MGLDPERGSSLNKQQLLAELGALGVSRLRVSGASGGNFTAVTAAASRVGDILEFGFDVDGLPFAHRIIATGKDGVRRLPGLAEGGSSLVATEHTWGVIKASRSLNPGSYDLHSEHSRFNVSREFTSLFEDTPEDRAAALTLQESIRGITEQEPHFLTVLHYNGLAQNHLVVADEREGIGCAVNQAGEHYLSIAAREGFQFIGIIGDIQEYWPLDRWSRLQTISGLTFNRMATATAVMVELPE